MDTQDFHLLRTAGFLLLGIVAVGASGCVSPLELTSTAPESAITIDGNNNDWSDALSYLDKEEVSLGIHDDGQWLSGCLVTSNRFIQMQILSGGFTVWFDPSGSTDERYGIRFPLRRSDSMPMRGNGSLTDFMTIAAAGLQEAEIVGPRNEDTQQFPAFQIPGIKVRVGVAGEALVYEFQVPLDPVAGCPIDLHEAKSKTIGIGFEAQGRASDQLPGAIGRSAPAGRGRRGLPSGPSAIAGGEREDILHFWTLVHLTKGGF